MTNLSIMLRLLFWLVIGTFCAMVIILGLFALALLAIIGGAL